ncbi:hypothetical protein B0T26DRAFT_723402 [Lasiosphaeria miniovina]|uniref:Uncharacterized protein n=1 Tax=Lasiosphaeria miniovina TaxID=1954250 RepID=A0AA40A627_9PEZI|nr:uncharacterized protein B0T26DRAFT_723402 [Lasiosphaeria miniovina]KAK0709885.1 hypothetical protein B0T26DRAFT_723402 [Lasiosphaeria miniovina]
MVFHVSWQEKKRIGHYGIDERLRYGGQHVGTMIYPQISNPTTTAATGHLESPVI